MVASCSAIGCFERYKKDSSVRFHRFPSDELLRKRWVLAMRRDFEPTMHARLCSKHFLTGRPKNDPSHPDYVPSIFSFPKKQKKKVQRQQVLEAVKERSPRTSTIPEIKSSGAKQPGRVADHSIVQIPPAKKKKTGNILNESSNTSSVTSVPILLVPSPDNSDTNFNDSGETSSNDEDAATKTCYDCSLFKSLVVKMNLQIANLQKERTFYKERNTFLEQCSKVSGSCLDCTLLKSQVEKMNLQIAILQEECLAYKAKNIPLEESSTEYVNTKELLKKMDLEINNLRAERNQYREQVRSPTKKIFSSKEKLFFYTGLNRPTIDWILEFAKENDLGFVKALSLETQVLCVLMKLRFGLTVRDSAFRYNISHRTMKRVFDWWIPILGPKLLTLKVGKGEDEVHLPVKLRKSVKDHLDKASVKVTKEDMQTSDQSDSEESISAAEEQNEIESVISAVNIVVSSNDNSREKLAASETDNRNSTNTSTNNEVEKSEATKCLEPINKNGSSKGLNNSTNIIYIFNSIKNNENSFTKENNKQLKNNEYVDSPKEVTNNGSEVDL